MSNKYQQLMEHLQVTPEMEQRVLDKALAACKEEAAPKAPIIPLKRYWPMAACLVAVLALAMVLPTLLSQQDQQAQPPVQMVNDMVTADSLEALSQAVNFPVTLPALPFEVEETVYTSLWGHTAQIACTGAEGEKALFRQSLGQEDNSGDYNEYPVVLTLGENLTLKGTEEGCTLALWQDGTYSYSLSLTVPLSQGQWEALLTEN